MTVLIDSWAWIEYWRGSKYADRAAEYIESYEEAVVSAINLAEVYYWILRHYDETTAEGKAASVRRRCFILPMDESVAIEAARIKRQRGKALADSIVLATAKVARAKVVTGDIDFRGEPEAVYIGD